MLECRDPPPLKLAILERPASVAPSSMSSIDTDSRGLATVDGVALDTAFSNSSGDSCRSGRPCPFGPPPSLFGNENETLLGGALLGEAPPSPLSSCAFVK